MFAWRADSVEKQLLQLFLLQTLWEVGRGQIRYSVSEESQHGTFVGRIAQDLGLKVSELVPRMFRMVSKEQGGYFEVNVQNGILFVNSRIDREALCPSSVVCIIHLEVLVDKPLKVFHVEVEIADINDNAPIFSVAEQLFTIAESSVQNSRFPLEGASDSDIAANSLLSYQLSPSLHFALEVLENHEHSASLFLILNTPLDREECPVHHLLLTAFDGGQPQLTGTVRLVIKVLDANDNPPVFNQSVYKTQLLENSVHQFLVIKLNATDLDEGVNKEITYTASSFSPTNGKEKFTLDQESGEVYVKGNLDFEERNFYEVQVEAKDKGNPPLSGHCKVLIEILDINDNTPEVSVMSLMMPVPEDSPLGLVVALISISDRDSGANGHVRTSLWPPGTPFKLESTVKNYYSLIVAGHLDREQVSEYKLVVTAQDQGAPSLSTTSILEVPVSDVNDNAPAFAQPSYTIFVKENNPPGAHIFTVSASDPDVAENSLISYWLDERLWPLSSYISVHSESGKLYALQPLDYEEKKLLEFQVSANDAGLPSLCGNVTIQVFVVDENDNAPTVSWSEDKAILLSAPVAAGHTVGKVHAMDADSGYNAWLCFEILEATRGPWRVGQYSGEISSSRALDDTEGYSSQTLLVLVKDHGKPPLSSTATLTLSLMVNSQAVQSDAHLSRIAGNPKPLMDPINLYLLIAICLVSSLFLLAALAYMVLRCHCQAKETVVCRPGTATLVRASEVGSWSYSNRHSHILAGVSGDSGGKSDLMVFTPNIPACVDTGEVGIVKEAVPNSSEQPKPPNPDWRYSASLRAGMQGAVHMDEAGGLRVGPGGPEQQWPTVSSATTDPEGGEVSPPVGAGVNSNSWTFKYGPGNSKQPGPGELPDKFIIPGSPAIISIRQDPPNSQTDKTDFITFGKKEETKKKKKKKKGNKAQEKKEKGNSTTDNSDQ